MSTRVDTERPQQPVHNINQLGLWDDLPECVDCGHPFYPDSSPDLERCWECAERSLEEPR